MRNWIIVFFVIFAARLSAHDGDSIKITHGPYLCDMSTDGVTVVWTTNKPALSWVEVAPAGEDHFYGKERPRYYDTESGPCTHQTFGTRQGIQIPDFFERSCLLAFE